MTRQFRLAARMAAVALAATPCLLAAQSLGPISVAFEAAPLSLVVRGFLQYTGRRIVVAPDVGEPLVTGSVQDASWSDGLDRLVSDRGLVVRPDSGGGYRIEKERTVTFRIDNAPLSGVLRQLSAFSGRTIALTPGTDDAVVTFVTNSRDWQRVLTDLVRDNGYIATPDAGGGFRISRP